MSQIDIKREYVEYVFMQNESKRWKKKEKDLQEYRETGEWLKVNKEQEEAIYKLI